MPWSYCKQWNHQKRKEKNGTLKGVYCESVRAERNLCFTWAGNKYVEQLKFSVAAKSLQSCPTLCDPRDGSPPGSPVPGTLQARILEWVAISFSNAWKVKSENEVAQSCLTLSDPQGLQPTRLLHPWDFPGKSTGVGCHVTMALNNQKRAKNTALRVSINFFVSRENS